MASQSGVFPIYLRAEYRGDGLREFVRQAGEAAAQAKREFAGISAVLDQAISRGRTGTGSLDLGVAEMRQAALAQQQIAIAAREVAEATNRAATANGVYNAEIGATARAAEALASSEAKAAQALLQQVNALEAVQTQLNQAASATSVLIGENLRLAQAEAGAVNGAKMLEAIYRGTSAELGRVAISARDSAAAFELLFQAQDARGQASAQAFFNAALGIDRQTKSAQDSAAAMRELFAAQEAAELSARQIGSAFLSMAQAEAAAANGARMVEATLRGTALAADRAKNSARESARAFEEAFERQAKAARDAKAAQDAYAASVAALKAKVDPIAAAQNRFNQEVAFAKSALDAGQISLREYDQAIKLASVNLREAGQAAVAAAAAQNGLTVARRRGTTEQGNVINGVRAERAAMIQFGQQLTDVTVQMEMGTRAMTIFTQQVPQLAFALSGLEKNSNATKAAIGRFATFMAGPWGAAIFATTAILGPLAMRIFDVGDKAEGAAKSVEQLVEEKRKSIVESRNLIEAESALMQTYDGLTDAIRKNKQALDDLNLSQDTAAEKALKSAGAILQKAYALQADTQQILLNRKAQLDATTFGLGDPNVDPLTAVTALDSARRQVDVAIEESFKSLEQLEQAQRNFGAASVRVGVEQTLQDDATKINRRYKDLIDNVTKEGIARGRNRDAILEEVSALEAKRKAEIEALKETRGRTTRAARDTTVRDQATTDRFLEQSAERVFRINERFQQQGRLVQQSAQATRQLDNIIADVNRRMTLARNLTQAQREEFQKIVKEAEEAKGTIEGAQQRPMQDALLESQRRIQLQSLISQGRVDEAAALQATFQLEQQFGDEMFLRMELQKAIVGGKQDEIAIADANLQRLLREKALLFEILMIEQQQIREIQRKQALMEAQANVARTVANDLRSILSGRSTDFFGNFQQALKDLQGARLFEKLFGPAFQQLEQELAGNTPQGRANRAYIEETKRVTTATKSLSDAFVELEDRVNSIMSGRAAANDNLSSEGYNPRVAMAMAGLSSIGLPGITVTGTKPPPAEFAQKSIKDIAREFSREVVKPGVELLSRLIGQEMAARVGEVVAGFIEGKARGGTVGGILGAGMGFIEGFRDKDGKLSKSLEGISSVLDKALDGAQTGSQVAGITAALGLPSNSTGAQIGGALGSAFGPVGSIVGAVAGNFLGALIAGIPKGSATVNGVGVTSVVGNRGSLREAAGGLGGGVNDIVSQVAKQLGGRINAAAAPVSIGIRDGDFRVDPRGRGTTRVKGGAIDFGEDQEAAVRYAAMLLIERGVIAGIKASEQRLLQAGKTLEDGLRDVLDFRGVFDRLREIRDPVGFAVERLNREFERLIDLFNRAGASAEELRDLRDLYDLERARAIEEASNRVIGSLRSLLNELTIGNSGLSLRSRQQNALAQFDTLAARVAAGDTSAFDDFADISKQLLDIERQLFGSTQSYFDRLAQITALTEKAVADQTNITSIAAAQPSPFPDRYEINRSIDVMNADVTGWLRAINDNLIALDNSRRVGSDAQNFNVFSGSGGGFLTFPNQMLAF